MKLIHILFCTLGTCSIFAQKRETLMNAFESYVPKDWMIEQMDDTYTLTKPDSIWVKAYRGSVFKTKNDPRDTICQYEDYETQMRCLSALDGTYRKILYQVSYRFEEKWTREKYLKSYSYNDSLQLLQVELKTKYGAIQDRKSGGSDSEDYYIENDSGRIKIGLFTYEWDRLDSEKVQFPTYSGEKLSIFINESKKFGESICNEQYNSEISSIEKKLADFFTRNTLQLGRNNSYSSSGEFEISDKRWKETLKFEFIKGEDGPAIAFKNLQGSFKTITIVFEDKTTIEAIPFLKSLSVSWYWGSNDSYFLFALPEAAVKKLLNVNMKKIIFVEGDNKQASTKIFYNKKKVPEFEYALAEYTCGTGLPEPKLKKGKTNFPYQLKEFYK